MCVHIYIYMYLCVYIYIYTYVSLGPICTHSRARTPPRPSAHGKRIVHPVAIIVTILLLLLIIMIIITLTITITMIKHRIIILHPVSITRFPLIIFSPGAGLLRNPFVHR